MHHLRADCKMRLSRFSPTAFSERLTFHATGAFPTAAWHGQTSESAKPLDIILVVTQEVFTEQALMVFSSRFPGLGIRASERRSTQIGQSRRFIE